MDRSSPVRDVMHTDVLVLAADDDVESALRALVDRGIDAAPVVDAEGNLVGVLSDSDLIVQETQLHFPTVLTILGGTFEFGHKQFEDDLTKALASSVSDLMTTEDLAVCGPDDSIEQAATLMHDRDVAQLPVTQDGRLVGVVTRQDILRAMLQSS